MISLNIVYVACQVGN
jgi:hypothetical protein